MALSGRSLAEKTKTTANFTWERSKDLIRLGDAAKVPIVGGAFGVAVEILDAFAAAEENNKSCQTILLLLSEYAEIIWEFVTAMNCADPEYLEKSDDRQADVARKAIERLSSEIDRVYVPVKLLTFDNVFKRVWYRKNAKAQIQDCEDSLGLAMTRFRAAANNILVASAHESKRHTEETQRILRAQAPDLEDHFGIAGAKPLAPGAIKDFVPITEEQDLNPELKDVFWTSIFEVEVEGTRRLAKIYNQIAGGKDSFMRDIGSLPLQSTKHRPHIWGHCAEATPPFIVFREQTFTPTPKTNNLPKPKVPKPEDTEPKSPIAAPGSPEMFKEMANLFTFFGEHLERIKQPV